MEENKLREKLCDIVHASGCLGCGVKDWREHQEGYKANVYRMADAILLSFWMTPIESPSPEECVKNLTAAVNHYRDVHPCTCAPAKGE